MEKSIAALMNSSSFVLVSHWGLPGCWLSKHASMPPKDPWHTNFGSFIRNGLFGSPDRGLNFTSFLLSVLSFGLSIFQLRSPEPIPVLIYVRDISIVLVFIFTILILMNRYYRRDYEASVVARSLSDVKQTITELLKKPHNLTLSYKGELARHFSDVIIQPKDGINEKELDLLKNILRFLVDGVREALIEHFKSRGIDIGDDVAISIKLIIHNDKWASSANVSTDERRKINASDQWVVTLWRDSHTFTNSRAQREVGGRVYDIRKNTAFNNIMVSDQPYFLHNDLTNMAMGYQNEITTWRSQYNAAMVIPIQYHNPKSGRPAYYGFITADSRNSTKVELYNVEECFYIISHAADILSTFFLLLELYHCSPPTN